MTFNVQNLNNTIGSKPHTCSYGFQFLKKNIIGFKFEILIKEANK